MKCEEKLKETKIMSGNYMGELYKTFSKINKELKQNKNSHCIFIYFMQQKNVRHFFIYDKKL